MTRTPTATTHHLSDALRLFTDGHGSLLRTHAQADLLASMRQVHMLQLEWRRPNKWERKKKESNEKMKQASEKKRCCLVLFCLVSYRVQFTCRWAKLATDQHEDHHRRPCCHTHFGLVASVCVSSPQRLDCLHCLAHAARHVHVRIAFNVQARFHAIVRRRSLEKLAIVSLWIHFLLSMF